VLPQEFEVSVLSSRARLIASPVVRSLNLNRYKRVNECTRGGGG